MGDFDLKRLIKDKLGYGGISAAAAKLGVHINTVSRWANGDCSITSQNVVRLAEILGVDATKLLQNLKGFSVSLTDLGKIETKRLNNFKLPDNPTEKPDDLVAVPILTSVQTGADVENFDKSSDSFYFPRKYLRDKLGINNAKNLHIVSAIGDSMSPAIKDGELLVVLPYENDRAIISGAIYIVNIDMVIYIKRLEITPSPNKTIMLFSDNDRYAPIIVDSSSKYNVIGRVVARFDRV
ncbi:MAG: XRE family transcriptional regulator [Helicobacteraceae bacterium]|jgi:phage repressor protein C with HTH and peptisase S24 domain|nr:XRE family transcriptional regulator [Helicobacteraceae bacterium]